MSEKDNMTVVVISYSFDAEVVAVICDDYPSACKFIKEDFERERKIDEEENGYEIDETVTKLDAENGYAVLGTIYRSSPETETTTWKIARNIDIRGQKEKEKPISTSDDGKDIESLRERFSEEMDLAVQSELGYDSDNLTSDGWDFLEYEASELILKCLAKLDDTELDDITQEDINEILSKIISEYEQTHSNIRYYE